MSLVFPVLIAMIMPGMLKTYTPESGLFRESAKKMREIILKHKTPHLAVFLEF